MKNIEKKIEELEKELDKIFEQYCNEVPVELLERYGYIQGYLDALKEMRS